jgi:hypothetical protein
MVIGVIRFGLPETDDLHGRDLSSACAVTP